MPRKNHGMWYEVHPTPVKDSDGKNLVYVRPKSGQKLTMKQLEDYCERTYEPSICLSGQQDDGWLKATASRRLSARLPPSCRWPGR